MVKHSAKFSPPIIEAIAHALELERPGKKLRIIDSFAGVGGIHALQEYGHRTVGVELEPEWANEHPANRVGNALNLPFRANSFDAWVTSPVYPNRNTDHHNAKDGSVRHSYKHVLGRDPSPGSACVLPWGKNWRVFHKKAFVEASRVTRPLGLLVVNCSNHKKLDQEILVNEWIVGCMRRLGFPLLQARPVATRRNGFMSNADKKVDRELVLVFKNVK